MRVLISGTSTGLGKQIAGALLASSHEVIGCSRGAATISHPFYTHYRCDLADASSVEQLFESLIQRVESLDALINNAAIARQNLFMTSPRADFERMFAVNVTGALHFTREAVLLLRRSELTSASIVSLSSVAVSLLPAGQSAYAASKAALEEATSAMAVELAPLNVRANVLRLPVMRTRMSRSLPEEQVANLISRQAFKRICTVEDVMGPLLFLLTNASAFITGETLTLGGMA